MSLTEAEARVLQALGRGQNVSEQAGRQGVRVSTIRTHVQVLLAKLGVDSQARLVVLARALPGLGNEDNRAKG